MYPYFFKNILQDIDIQNIISYINNNSDDFGELKDNDYWSGRTLYYNGLADNGIQKLILRATQYGSKILLDTISTENSKQIYCEHLSIARWPKGYELLPHADAENPPGFPKHPYPWRDFAMITFLNNNFEGGLLYFPNQKIDIVPKPGYTIIFPGTLEYLHGVTKILSGTRYTIASFWTYSPDKSSIILS